MLVKKSVTNYNRTLNRLFTYTMNFAFIWIAFYYVTYLTLSCVTVTQNILRLPHIPLLSFPPSIMETARDIFGGFSLDKYGGKLVSNEKDVVSDLQLSNH